MRTITAVATSITAFVGRALRGPTDRPVTVRSFADFERAFGGLWMESSLGYSVRDFFRLGGSTRGHRARPSADQRCRGRLPRVSTAMASGPGTADLPSWPARPGRGAAPRRSVEDRELHRRPGGRHAGQRVRQEPTPGTGRVEAFRNVSMNPASAQRIDTVLENGSRLVRMQDGSTCPPHARQRHTERDRRTPGPTAPTRRHDPEPRPSTCWNQADLVNLLVIPPYTKADTDAVGDRDRDRHRSRRRHRGRHLRLQPGRRRTDRPPAGLDRQRLVETGAATQPSSANAALYFPRIRQPDPLRDGQIGTFAPCGAVAGIIARTDATRGVWKAPAGLDATLGGVDRAVACPLTDAENGELNPLGINCLRTFPVAGRVVWGARTLRGADQLAVGVEVRAGAAHGAVPRGEPVPRHAVGRVRAERRAAVGADPAQRRRVHAEPVPPGRVPGHDAARGLLRQVRQARPRRRTTSTSASSTSSSASRRSSRPSSSSSRSSRWPARSQA